jgi:ribosomal protein S27AE
MKRGSLYTWDLTTGKIDPYIPALETWEDYLDDVLSDVEDWLHEGLNVTEALSAVEEVLRQKHHDYGEDNLHAFGELGILVRASDKVARLKNLLDMEASGTDVPAVSDESRADTWRDLAGYAIQALIMMKCSKEQEPVNYYEIRKNRLERGYCPDCGEGVLLRKSAFDNTLRCSAHCGFEYSNVYVMQDYNSVASMIDIIARSEAIEEQK